MPMLTLVPPPIGNVPLVACPSVWKAHEAGASSSAPNATATTIARAFAGSPNASAVAPPIPSSSISGLVHAAPPAPLPRTTSSHTMPATIASGATIRAVRPSLRTMPTVAPTSAAVNGASSET